MKYLKLFNESKLNDIKELSNSCLSYLIDNKFKIFIKEQFEDNMNFLFIREDEMSFKWAEIREDFLSFVELIDSKYRILGTCPFEVSLSDPLWKNNGKAVSPISSKFFTLDEFLNIDNLPDSSINTLKVRYIEFRVRV